MYGPELTCQNSLKYMYCFNRHAKNVPVIYRMYGPELACQKALCSFMNVPELTCLKPLCNLCTAPNWPAENLSVIYVRLQTDLPETSL